MSEGVNASGNARSLAMKMELEARFLLLALGLGKIEVILSSEVQEHSFEVKKRQDGRMQLHSPILPLLHFKTMFLNFR